MAEKRHIPYFECLECGGKFHKLVLDPREPPLDEDSCVCQDCYDGLAEERIEELQEQIEEVRDGMASASTIKDCYGKTVHAGDRVTFSYGIPPVRVIGTVTREGRTFWVNTPGHNPEKSLLAELEEHVGTFQILEK